MSSKVETFSTTSQVTDATHVEEEKLNALKDYLEYKKNSFFEITEQMSECVHNWYYENSANDEEFCMELKNTIATMKEEKALIEKQIGKIIDEIRYQTLVIHHLKIK